ncbi:MAG: transglycosylase domain-containing protein [Defluviitaleaceae bacterium]|nr:transglycosylase domain-containing protein [Defluviitaleaceae bacterium]
MDYSKSSNQRKRKAAVSKAQKARNRFVTVAFRFIVSAILIIVFAAGGIVLGAYVGILDSVAHMEGMQFRATIASSIVLDRHGQEIWSFRAEEDRQFVPLYQMPLHLQQAFIAIEDQRFFEHNGVDVRGTLRAIYVTLTSDRSEGGSTITQQLIKNNIMGLMYNTVETKLQEQFLALRLERYLIDELGSKEAAKYHILEEYLNTINLGRQLHGVQTAAQFYFNKDVSDLTISESAVLAAITQWPVRYDPINNPENNRVRQTTVLDRMLAQGFITEREHAEALADNVFDRISEFRLTQVGGDIRSYFIDHLFVTLRDDLVAAGIANTPAEAGWIIHNRGLVIETTMDSRTQSIMEEAFLDDSFFPGSFEITIEYQISFSLDGNIYHQEHQGTVFTAEQVYEWVEATRNEVLGENGVLVNEIIHPTPQPQSAMVVMDHRTGQVRGIVGGRGEKLTNLAFDRATAGRRHPGSVFKMVAAYAPALDLGIVQPASQIRDEPITVGEWSPQNWDNTFRGRVDLRFAVAMSGNVAAVHTMMEVGVDRAFQYLLDFGFDLVDEPDQWGNTDRGLATVLGGLTHGVTQLEMVGAFGAIANAGQFIEPTVYTRVLDNDGNLLLAANPQVRQVMRPAAAYLLTSTMEDVITRGTGTPSRLATNIAVAGKTGTSQNVNDLNFTGFTPYYVASIWLGHDQPRGLGGNRGNSHQRLWAHIMNEIHDREDISHQPNFNRPPGIVSVTVCADTGLLPSPGCRTRTDIFDELHVPTQRHTRTAILIDALTGLPITGETPIYRITEVLVDIDPITGLPMNIGGEDGFFGEGFGNITGDEGYGSSNEFEFPSFDGDIDSLPDLLPTLPPGAVPPGVLPPSTFPPAVPPPGAQLPGTLPTDALPVLPTLPNDPPAPPTIEMPPLPLPTLPDITQPPQEDTQEIQDEQGEEPETETETVIQTGFGAVPTFTEVGFGNEESDDDEE